MEATTNQTTKGKKKKGCMIALFVSLGLLLIIIIIASIGDSNNSQSARSSTEQVGQVGKPIETGYFVYSVDGFEFRKSIGGSYYRQTADGVYLLVSLTLKNISKETRILDGSAFYVTDASGVKYENNTTATTALEMTDVKTLFLKQCQPNIPTKGVLAFEVPDKGAYYIHLAGNFWGGKSVKVLLQ